MKDKSKVIVWTMVFIVSVLVAHIGIFGITMGLSVLIPFSVADNIWLLLIPFAANIVIHGLLHVKMRKLSDNQDKMMNDFAEAWLWAGVGVIPTIYIGANYLKLLTFPVWVTSYWILIPLAIIVFSSLVKVGLEIHTVVQKHDAMVAEAERKKVIEENKSTPSVRAIAAGCKNNHVTITKGQFDANIAALVKVGVLVPVETDGLFAPDSICKFYISDKDHLALTESSATEESQDIAD